jgi:nucleoside-diphosphate-sugar epimerase
MILVTGGTGFLGAHLIYHLLIKGEHIRALKRTDSDMELISRVFSYYGDQFAASKIDWFEGDLLDIISLDNALEGVDEVYHAGAMVSFQSEDKDSMMQVNIEGTANLVNLALNHKIKKFCHVSSIAALGRAESNKILNEGIYWKASKKNSNYAVSKYGAEREVWRGIEEGLNAIIVNPSVIFGPGEINSGIAKMIKMVLKGFKFYTSGINGFVDVRDVVKAMIKLMEKEAFGERYIVSSENLPYREVFNWIAGATSKPAPSIEATPFLSQVAWRVEHIRKLISGSKPLITKETALTASNIYQYSNTKIKRELNFKFLSVRQSIEDSVAFYMQEEMNK